MKKKIIICLILLLTLTLSACKKEAKLYEYTCFDCGFDTFWKFYTYSENQKENEKYFNYMKERSLYLHKLFDIYHTYDGINNLKSLNDNAGIKELEVDTIVIDLIELAKAINDLSNNHFDITNGAIFKLWHNYRDEGKIANQNGEYGKIPSDELLIANSAFKGYDKIIIDKEKNTIFISDSNISLDVGGIAKGYSVEIIANELQKMGFNSGAINAGGNLRLISLNPNTKVQNTSIQDPYAKNSYSPSSFIRFGLKDVTSIVTSGNYLNYYYIEGDKKMHHIIDPKTLKPAEYYDSVTIFCKDAGIADALSTTLFTMSIEDGLILKNKIKEKYNLDIEIFWIIGDNPYEYKDCYYINDIAYYYTDGLNEYILKDK